MLTIFAVPKAFEGQISVIQRNAIKSWTMLDPRPEIILLGDEPGIGEIAAEFDLKYIPVIRRNKYGTPVLSDVFKKAQAAAVNQLLCYVNSDIIFTGDVMDAVRMVKDKPWPFLMIGKHWKMDISTPLEFSEGWESALRADVLNRGRQNSHYVVDYFIFKKGLWENMPDFAIGRFVWDWWLMADVLDHNIPMIDASSVVMAVHQNHGYKHCGVKKDENFREGPECRLNTELARGKTHDLANSNIKASKYVLTKKGLKPYIFSRNCFVNSDFYYKYMMKIGAVGQTLKKHLPFIYKTLKPKKDMLIEKIFPKYRGERSH